MNIHQILQVVTRPGTVLSYAEIKAKVQAAFPETRAGSILPSEHVRGHCKNCKRCQQQPLFEKLGHGLYRVLPQSEREADYSVHDKMRLALAEYTGQVLKVATLRQLVLERFPQTHLPSVIPSDHSYGGACRICAHSPLLERTGQRGLYRVLSLSPTRGASLKAPSEAVGILRQLLQNEDLARLQEQSEAFAQRLRQTSLPQREIHLLLAALQARIPNDLLDYGPLLAPELLQTRLAQRLYDQQGISLNLAHGAIQTWKQALQPALTAYASGGAVVSQVAEKTGRPGFRHLQAQVLRQGVRLFKKRRRRVALSLQQGAFWLLGLRAELLTPVLESKLSQTATAVDVRPSVAGQRTEAFKWYQLNSQADLDTLLWILDQSFG